VPKDPQVRKGLMGHRVPQGPVVHRVNPARRAHKGHKDPLVPKDLLALRVHKEHQV
jgi:hypothetical protein